MKKIVLTTMMILGLIGCGVNCPSKPPRRAVFHENGDRGMMYHITIYIPYGQLSHSPQCTQYSYIPIHIYADSLGTLRGDEVIWDNGYGQDLPFQDNGDKKENIVLNISKEKIVIKGFRDNHQNGTYKVETSSPDSWGVPIDGP